jgi:N-acyl-D-aspartate/D-glutamate deacylase
MGMNYLIKNGTIVDGTGKIPYEGDLLVENGKIADLGDLKEQGDFKVIDGENLVVCPGFIDVSNHSDVYWTLFDYPVQESLITQGITTIIGGNCGTSLAPLLNEEALNSLQKYTEINKSQVRWDSFGSLMEFLSTRKFNPNFASLVGHLTLRRAIVGDEMRQLRSDELQIMAEALERSLEEGALGFSSGLVYSHTRIASGEEIIKMAEITAKAGKVFSIHLREEGREILSSVREALAIAEATQVKLQIAHLKVCGRKNWRLQKEVLTIINEARNWGLDVSYDAYPYAWSGPVLYTLLPKWVSEGGKGPLLSRIKDPQERHRVIQSMQESGFDYGGVIVATSNVGKSLANHRVAVIAKNQERSIEEVFLDLVSVSENRITGLVENINQKNIKQLIAEEGSFVSTNGAGYSSRHLKEGELVHPRCFGAMPYFLRSFVFSEKILSLEDAIAKITSGPATKYGLLRHKGTLEKGKDADIVVFDPRKIKGKATIDSPFVYSEGIKELFIGGNQAISNYKITQDKLGRPLTI